MTMLGPVLKTNYSINADGELIAAPGAGKAIRVHAWVGFSAANSITLESSTTAKAGPFTLTAAPGGLVSFMPDGWFDCGENEALNADITGTDLNTGSIVYSIVKV